MTVGVLALQGAFAEHEKVLQRLGVNCIELRQAKDLETPYDGIVLPGGESTVQGKLLRELGMFDKIKEQIKQGMPILATCAGLILLASEVEGAPVALAANLLPLPLEWDLFGATFFSEYPLTLTQLDPAFALPAAGWIAKAVYLAVGVGFAALAVHLERKTVLKGLQS